jgi:hypothetical protein
VPLNSPVSTLARAVSDESLSREILKTVAELLKNGCMSTSGSGTNASISLSSISRTKGRRRRSDEGL